jgi:hypothetical protein
MPETVEALLWCAALATWLMMLFTIIKEGEEDRGPCSQENGQTR